MNTINVNYMNTNHLLTWVLRPIRGQHTFFIFGCKNFANTQQKPLETSLFRKSFLQVF